MQTLCMDKMVLSPKNIKGRQHTLFGLGSLGGGGRGRKAQLTTLDVAPAKCLREYKCPVPGVMGAAKW